ncbi:MAG TPA: hypothetical protein VH309_14350 [Elusimicrobiota bacterium]|jgi:hypothetical protein|nr:hypothetical protein [Elusimicrobiota bacterium]
MSIKPFPLTAAILFVLAGTASALVQPQRINFQGKLINPSTNNPQTGPVSLTFSLYNVPTGGSPLYTETQNNVALTNGVFSVEIGTQAAISRELFLGASVYLGVTVVGDAGGEMVPRQNLVMSAYAFTANQLSDSSEVRLIAGPTYSTFTSAGNLTVPGGVAGSSGSFTNGLTASSGTFTATGAAQYSITTSSGINMSAGTLDVTGTSGILASDTGITLSTIDFTGQAADPSGGNPGYMYYNTSTGSLKVYDGTSAWAYLFGQSLSRKSVYTTTGFTALATKKSAAAAIIFVPFYLPGPMMIDAMQCDITTALGATGDIGIYNAAGTLVLNGGSGSLSVATGLKTVAPTQTGAARFLPPGQYYAAITYNSTTGYFAGDALAAAGAISGTGSIATGGGSVLPASITPSSIVASAVYFYFEAHP